MSRYASFTSINRTRRISQDRIGKNNPDKSIKLQFNPNEDWTTACKYTLTQLKWILSFCVRRIAEQQVSPFGEKTASTAPSRDNSAKR
jgi:hypothetical protein